VINRAIEDVDNLRIVKNLFWIAGIVALLVVGDAPSAHQPATLDSVASSASKLPRLKSLLVSHDGNLVLERYFNGARATQVTNIKSASKSVISALVGIAIAKGHIKGADQRIVDYFPELTKDPVEGKRRITIGDLVTMRSGLESTSGRGYGAWVTSKNWVRYVLARPLEDTPGTRVEYSTGTSHLLSAILTKATKMSTWQFAQAELAKPLGFSLAQWPTDPQGIYFGGNDMLMTPKQMVSFGELYLNDGRVGDRQIIPKEWVEKADDGVGRSRWGSDREYGHGFWIRDFGGVKSYYAWGYGGQFIFIVPSKNLVIVTTSRVDVSTERRDHLDQIYDLAGRIVAGT
jgi:CubicO group peptidase (beta-lactamase class C family)